MAIGRIAEWIKQRKLRKIWCNPPQLWTFIDGQREAVSEVARRQAAINMSADPALRQKIVEMLGEEKARLHYPEAWL